jgi:SNF2 family DNA or RNA helicase
MVECDWVPGNNAQAIMRAHRRGQKNTVFARFVSIEDSVDQKVTRVYRRKALELTQIFDSNESHLIGE